MGFNRSTMKYLLLILTLVLWVLQSCTKEKVTPVSPRNIEFQLYTNQDFSSETNTIRFSIFIKSGNTTVLDSALAPRLIKDIPTIANKIIIQKRVPASVTGELSAGFNYAIDNVGISWYKEKVLENEESKVISFSFK